MPDQKVLTTAAVIDELSITEARTALLILARRRRRLADAVIAEAICRVNRVTLQLAAEEDPGA